MAGSDARRWFAMGEAKVSWDAKTMTANIKGIPKRQARAVEAAFHYHKAPLLNYARQNAPWTDRTGNARNGLFTQVNTDGKGGVQLVLAHGVPYGIWLEVRWSGRFAIIAPAIQHEGPLLMKTIAKMCGQELTT